MFLWKVICRFMSREAAVFKASARVRFQMSSDCSINVEVLFVCLVQPSQELAH